MVYFLHTAFLEMLWNSNNLNLYSEISVRFVDLSTNVQYLRCSQLLRSYSVSSMWIKWTMGYVTGEITQTGEVWCTRRKRVPLLYCLQQIPCILLPGLKAGFRSKELANHCKALRSRVQTVATDGCGAPLSLHSFHHNASKQATSCNVLVPSFLAASLSFSVIFDKFCTYRKAVT